MTEAGRAGDLGQASLSAYGVMAVGGKSGAGAGGFVCCLYCRRHESKSDDSDYLPDDCLTIIGRLRQHIGRLSEDSCTGLHFKHKFVLTLASVLSWRR